MEDLKLASYIYDKKIESYNLLFEMQIESYLKIAEPIMRKNPYQRKRVRGSKSVYSLLRDDLKIGCTIPPIVMALMSDMKITNPMSNSDIDNITKSIMESDKLLILDGLQRTNSMLDVREELKDNPAELEKFHKQPIRVEFYIGLDKIGILYRMLTLNTGQTTMSTRHQIEILYSDLIDVQQDGLKFHSQAEGNTKKSFTEYQFKDAIECFNSYLQSDPNGIDRGDILDNIANLEKLSTENQHIDLFHELISAFKTFMEKINAIISGHNDLDFPALGGKDVVHFFNKSIVMSAFGAAIGDLRENEFLTNIAQAKSLIASISMTPNSCLEFLSCLNDTIGRIKKDASGIGVEQRRYYFYFFKHLFVSLIDSPNKVDMKSIVTKAYQRYAAL